MTFINPFEHAFMVQALVIAMLVASVCAVFSCFLVLKGWALMGDAISHAILPGIVIAYVAGIPLSIGAFCAGLFCAVSTGYVKNNSRLKEDTVMGVIFTGMFAFGLVMFTKVDSDQHLNHILFGSLLGVPYKEMIQVLIIGILTLLVTLFFRKDLLLYCFDADHARSIGLNTRFLHYLMLSLLSLTIVASLQAVGIILVVAMLITPGAIGFLLSSRFSTMLFSAWISAVLASLTGVYLSFILDASAGACIVLMQSLFFLLALFFAPKRGLLIRRSKMAV